MSSHENQGNQGMIPTNFIRRLSSSTFNYWAGYVANLSLIAWLYSFVWMKMTLLQTAGYFALGLFFWTFGEYWLHRYAYHVWKSPLSIGHGLHHDTPRALLGVPWYLTLVVIVAVFYALALVFSKPIVGIVLGTFWLGYVGYCITHHAVHHWNFNSKIFKNLKKHHYVHHAMEGVNLGITSTLWDHVFRTHVKS